MITIGLVGKDKEGSINVYCGRPGKGAASVFGNPWVIGVHGTREEVIKKFGDYYLEQVKINGSPIRNETIKLYKELKNGKSINLQCFCAPKNDCHTRHIKEFLEKQLNI